MRRLLPTARSFLIHSGQTAALLAVGVLAMAAAPNAMMVAVEEEAVPVAAEAAPEAPPVTAVARPAGPMMRTIMFARPIVGYAINSRFGIRHLAGEGKARAHQGVDIAAPTGTPVLSAAEGEVVRTGNQPSGYGRFIEVRHPNGLTSFYGHLSRVEVSDGDRLAAGETIGRVGTTGYSTGPHLHFEIRRDGAKMNPEQVLGQEYAVEVNGPMAS